MGLWNRKFDYKNGEQRVCKGCSATFHTIKPRYRCNQCLNAAQRIIEQKKRDKYERKPKYPFRTTTNEAERRFSRIHGELVAAWKEGTREALTKHYDKQIKEIEENGIMQWIMDRRDKETLDAKKMKSKKNITKDYPNMHDYYEY